MELKLRGLGSAKLSPLISGHLIFWWLDWFGFGLEPLVSEGWKTRILNLRTTNPNHQKTGEADWWLGLDLDLDFLQRWETTQAPHLQTPTDSAPKRFGFPKLLPRSSGIADGTAYLSVEKFGETEPRNGDPLKKKRNLIGGRGNVLFTLRECPLRFVNPPGLLTLLGPSRLRGFMETP